MKRMLLPLFAILLITACEKEEIIPVQPNDALGGIEFKKGNFDDLLEVTINTGKRTYTLYVTSENQSTVQWGGFDTDIPKLDNKTSLDAALADFDGKKNTKLIVKVLGEFGSIDYAAKVCDDLEYAGFDDWYLPSFGELHAMYEQLGPATFGNNGSGDMPSGIFWSSTEINDNSARALNFSSGTSYFANKNISISTCRCVRR